MDKVRFGGKSFKNSVKADGEVVSPFSLQIKLVLCFKVVPEIVPLSHSIVVLLGKFSGPEELPFPSLW